MQAEVSNFLLKKYSLKNIQYIKSSLEFKIFLKGSLILFLKKIHEKRNTLNAVVLLN